VGLDGVGSKHRGDGLDMFVGLGLRAGNVEAVATR